MEKKEITELELAAWICEKNNWDYASADGEEADKEAKEFLAVFAIFRRE